LEEPGKEIMIEKSMYAFSGCGIAHIGLHHKMTKVLEKKERDDHSMKKSSDECGKRKCEFEGKPLGLRLYWLQTPLPKLRKLLGSANCINAKFKLWKNVEFCQSVTL